MIMDFKNVEALLDRAGCGQAVTLIPEKTSVQYDEMRSLILNTCDALHDGSMVDFVAHLTAYISRMEYALKKALNERDALLDDLKAVDTDCETCAHSNDNAEAFLSNDCNCQFCQEACFCKACSNDKNNYKWRGVQNKEENK